MTNSHDEKAKAQLEDAEDQVTQAISETMDLYGVTPAAGKIYATMYFEDQMNLDEMREKLGMSKPSMSTNVRHLQEIGMVKRNFNVVQENILILQKKISFILLCPISVRCGNGK
ncbi:hypothetical protein GCM10025857_42410 [Alicyclobacillus contaminans]|nr:hypothetical protein GCM10025857_42410 [Alicyclobacillus contaminans]